MQLIPGAMWLIPRARFHPEAVYTWFPQRLCPQGRWLLRTKFEDLFDNQSPVKLALSIDGFDDVDNILRWYADRIESFHQAF